MRFKYSGNKKDVAILVVKNGDSIGIKAGAPVFLKESGTDDGLSVISSNNIAAVVQQGFFGFATADIAAGAFGEAQIAGYYDYARVRTTTRAASTDVWASYVAGALNDMMGIATGTGGVAGSVSADQAISRIAAGSAISVSGLWPIVLGQTYASQTTLASSLSGGLNSDASATASITAMKVLVRAF